MKVEGIPSTVEMNHNHTVVLEVAISDETAKHVKDIGLTLLYGAATAYIIKASAILVQKATMEVVYQQAWKLK